jgi:hypothetical protein
MSVARSYHAATLLADGKLLVVGGDGEQASAELFDPADAAFVPTGSLTAPHQGISAMRMPNGEVLIAGGNSIELYDPLTGTFRGAGTMPATHVRPTTTLLADGRILLAGGTAWDSSKGKAVADADLFDPEASALTPVSAMISARASHAATLLNSGQVLIVGGRNGWLPDSADDPPWDPLFAELFNPTTDAFTSAGTMTTTRIRPLALALPGNKALVLGGIPHGLQNIHEQPVDPRFAEVFDGASRTFAALATPTIPVQTYTATLLSNGRVLIVGGEIGTQVVDAVAVLDPSTGGLTEEGRLTTARAGHTATLLSDGRVLVTGGFDSDGNALASAEIWTRTD